MKKLLLIVLLAGPSATTLNAMEFSVDQMLNICFPNENEELNVNTNLLCVEKLVKEHIEENNFKDKDFNNLREKLQKAQVNDKYLSQKDTQELDKKIGSQQHRKHPKVFLIKYAIDNVMQHQGEYTRRISTKIKRFFGFHY